MGEQRINGNMNLMESVLAVSNGNPGAITSCMMLANNAAKIDPDNVFGAFSALTDFDEVGIYGSKIYDLYTGVCYSSPVNLFALFRHRQLGLGTTVEDIHRFANARDNGERIRIDFSKIISEVQGRVSHFNRVDDNAQELTQKVLLQCTCCYLETVMANLLFILPTSRSSWTGL